MFLRDGFAKIFPKILVSCLTWNNHEPSEGIIDLLVQRFSGQFIYAATVLKFVGADFCSPTKQLEVVLKPDPTAFSDQLYTNSYLSIQAMWTLFMFWESSLHLMELQQR